MKSLAEEVRQTAEELNIPITDFYEKTGILSSSMSQWENGTRARPKTVQKIRRKLEALKTPKAEGFTSRKVEEGVKAMNDDHLIRLIEMICMPGAPGYTATDKLSAIRYLLSK